MRITTFFLFLYLRIILIGDFSRLREEKPSAIDTSMFPKTEQIAFLNS